MEKLTEKERQMVEDNLALAYSIAKKYLTTDYVKNQDIIQEARMALMKAIPKYDETKAKFSTYAYPTIDGHLKRYSYYRDRIIPIPHQTHLKEKTKEAAKNAKNIFSLDRKIGNANSSNYEEYSLMDIIPDEIAMEENTVNKLSITDAILSLEWKEKLVIIYRYYFDLNQTYIGTLMGISQVHTHRIERKALQKMRQFIEGT